MKVLLVNSVCGSGSTGKICVDLYDELKKREHECVIAYGRGDASSNYNTYRIGSKLNNYIDGFKSRVFDNQGFNSKNPTRKFIRYIKEYNPDVIHLHNLHGYYLNIEILFNFLKDEFKGKVIWTFHDCWPFLPRSAYLPDLEKYEYLPEIEPKSSIKNYPKSFIFNNSKNQYKRKKDIFSNVPNLTIVTPSLWLSNLVIKTFLSDYNIITINNGINIEKFKNNGILLTKKFHNKMLLGVANIWDERKGISFFNELVDCIDDEFSIVLVGRVLNESILDPRITIIEQTKSVEELVNLYNEATIFINPTIQDNYPTTNIEAICCGTPVILFDTGGNKEVISDETGILCKSKNVQELVAAVDHIMEKYKTFNPESQKNYYSKNRMVSEYINNYEQIGDENEKNSII